MNDLSRASMQREIDQLQAQLNEAKETLEAIRNGEVDALVVNDHQGLSLFTLRSADRSYRLFIEQMTEGAVTLNHEGLVIYSNSQFARLVRQPLSKVMGSFFSDYIYEQDRPLFKELLSRGWKSNTRSELKLTVGDVQLDVQLSLAVLEMDEDTALSVIVTDLTNQKDIERQLMIKNEELRRLNDALIASNHDLQQFASVASHDLQEPLRKIQVFSKFLKDKEQDNLSSSAKTYIEKIFSSSQRMKMLIIDILTYSKLSGDNSLADTIDLKEIIGEIVDDFDLRISEKNARIEVSGLCVVEGNKGQLRQVFQNLISNALKFVAPGRQPHITIQLAKPDPTEVGILPSEQDNYCQVNVSDNGIGFENNYSSAIFSLFETLNPKGAYEGSGIGLAIAKKIIEKHRGFILAKSKVGEGSEFSVILPFKQPNFIG
ncbi:MAG TPA: ATP-binding protein [Cyclobacteriaceae bacterium]|nr:ATP-binding protein [Cyclobacteriaceae bacterium]